MVLFINRFKLLGFNWLIKLPVCLFGFYLFIYFFFMFKLLQYCNYIIIVMQIKLMLLLLLLRCPQTELAFSPRAYALVYRCFAARVLGFRVQ